MLILSNIDSFLSALLIFYIKNLYLTTVCTYAVHLIVQYCNVRAPSHCMYSHYGSFGLLWKKIVFWKKISVCIFLLVHDEFSFCHFCLILLLFSFIYFFIFIHLILHYDSYGSLYCFFKERMLNNKCVL